MAVRLHMKLGLVAEHERLEDSPDAVAVVEPTIGATARSKGSLYLVVSATSRAKRIGEATRMVAEAIQGDYYYDESAGLIVCLEKAIRSANRKLTAQHERFGFPVDSPGPIGIGVAVVRSNELYVVTSGPVEAFLVRQAHLLTLPDDHRAHGLPHEDTAPSVWRGEITAGDSLVLISSNVTAHLGPDELKDAVVTLHPQAAMEHLHHRFVAAGGTGSDGALAIEATEVSATTRRGQLVPVRPPEPLAGQPDRSPIPLVDSVGAGAAAATAGAARARTAAGSAVTGILGRLQDLLPRRGPRFRRVTPAASRRESQRRAALAVLAFVGVASALGIASWVAGGSGGGNPVPAITAGEKALAAAREDVRLVFDNGTDLVVADPNRATQLLNDALDRLAEAGRNGIPAAATSPIRQRAVAGLDRLYGVVGIAASVAFAFPAQTPAFDLGALVLGPDGAPYVLDRGTKTVYRIDLKGKKAQPIIKAGTAGVAGAGGAKIGTPKILSAGGQDILVLDDKNALWRWRPSDAKGTGTLSRIAIPEATTWGSDISILGTFVPNPNDGLYRIYVVDPSGQQILKYSPLADGSGYTGAATKYLTNPQDLSQVTSIYIDGEVYLADNGTIERFAGGSGGGWRLGDPGDSSLRPTHHYTLIDSPGLRGLGTLYAYDADNSRIVAFDKATGKYASQYRPADGSSGLAGARGLYVVDPGNGKPPTAWWIDGQRLLSAPLVQATPAASPSPSSSPAASPPASPKASPKATPKATKRPVATPRPKPSG